jgi:hypothetical protein
MIPDNIGDFGKNLTNDEARMKLLSAEMTLANIRSLCGALESLPASRAVSLIAAIDRVAQYVPDKEVRAACEVFGKIRGIKDQLRELAIELLEFTGPDPYK